jgi:ATP-dependent RNA helicase DHX36
MISNNQYSIIVGATGSGKTTQVHQILLEQAIAMGEGASCNIICTQPPRIAATSIAQRVAMERNEKIGESVGYSVRFDSKWPRLGGSITYCTTGFLLEQLKFMADSIFNTTSHIVIDEVHERDRDTDFLLVVLKKALAARRAEGKNIPKIVIMSATLNAELFQEYFAEQVAGGSAGQCPIIDVPGRTFPVEETYLYDIVSQLRAKYNADFQMLLANDLSGEKYLSSEDNFSRPRSSWA